MSSDASNATHSGRPVCKVKDCGNDFGRQADLNKHIKEIHHLDPEDPDNGETYFNAGGTTRLSHPKANPGEHICKKCGNNFVRQSNLNDHIMDVHGFFPEKGQDFVDAGGKTRLSNSQSTEASHGLQKEALEPNQNISQDRPSVGSSTQPTPIHQLYESQWPPAWLNAEDSAKP